MIAEKIDDLIGGPDKMVRREIDASHHQTGGDWQRFHEAESAYYALRDQAVQDLVEIWEEGCQ